METHTLRLSIVRINLLTKTDNFLTFWVDMILFLIKKSVIEPAKNDNIDLNKNGIPVTIPL